MEVIAGIVGMRKMAPMIPEVEKGDAKTVAFTFDDLLTAFKAFRAILALASLNI